MNQSDKSFHFISGLPRSGSTLLAALLRQNPRFHADISSPLAGMYNALLREVGGASEYSVFFSDARRHAVLKGMFDGYYAGYSAGVIFDNNRLWCARLPALEQLFPRAKVIACVRDTSWILDSFERLARKNAFRLSAVYGYDANSTVYSRATALAASTGVVGYAYDSVKEAFYGEQAGRLMLVEYDTLVRSPRRTMEAIYEFIGEPAFDHDFNNIEFDAADFDERLATPGLHAVGRQVRVIERQAVLPPDLFGRFENDAFWRDPANNPRNVRVI
ncbi:sulfotransferase [Burkholderia ubonensis]|uniref:sulfotransferase family protein n=1 Tax=Burkholderia ubonensis TaxID=101571 RepID=UPI00075BD524|nr:sulfotransferase [Burkholderia ubonensis]KVU29775.1 sulfotransferase [Burkholderia ubonensis]